MKDGAVVVLYNPDEREFKNILGYAGIVDITYIIDNSQESHLEQCLKVMNVDGCSIVYKHYPENVGLCRGMNLGIQALREYGCSWALTMNPDSYFKNNVISIFREYVNTNDCSNVALLAPVFHFDRHKARTYTGTKELKRVMMSGNYVNIDIFSKMGGFLEVLFVDGLDNDYCIRCKREGYKIIECGTALMEHMPCKTGRKNILGKTILYGFDTSKRYYGHGRALSFLVRRYKTLYEFEFYIFKLLKILFLFDHKREYLKAYLKGTRDGMIAEKNTRGKLNKSGKEKNPSCEYRK